MGKGRSTAADVLSLVLVGTLPSWRTGAAVYVALHAFDPAPDGHQLTGEIAYGGYQRLAILRRSGWRITAAGMVNAVDTVFPACTSGGAVASHFSIGTAPSGVGQVLYSGALSAPLTISPLVEPAIAAGALLISEA